MASVCGHHIIRLGSSDLPLNFLCASDGVTGICRGQQLHVESTSKSVSGCGGAVEVSTQDRRSSGEALVNLRYQSFKLGV